MAVKEEKVYQITEDYGFTLDRYNITLVEKYEKRDGKGKHAPLSGEFGWREEGHYGSFDSLLKGMQNYEIMNKNPSDFIEMIEKMEKLYSEMSILLKEKIVIQNGVAGDKD